MIADTTNGELYVGKADGRERLLGRWSQYARDGHGGNMALRGLAGLDRAHARHFQFSILRVFGPDCTGCEHFVLTGADYGYWKRQEQRWAALAEAAPDQATRDYLYHAFDKSSQAIAGLEKALLALGLLDQAQHLDLRSPHQDFFDPLWRQGWRAGDLIQLGIHQHIEDGVIDTEPAGQR